LEGIFSFLRIAEDAAADAQDHRAMPPCQKCESILIALVSPTCQQRGIWKRRLDKAMQMRQ
jgi:hypothetical protein